MQKGENVTEYDSRPAEYSGAHRAGARFGEAGMAGRGMAGLGMPVERIATDDFARKLLLTSMEREWKQLFDRFKELFEEFLALVTLDIQGER